MRTPEEIERIQTEAMRDFKRAAGRAYVLPVHLDFTALASVIGALQLALRHPANTGPSSSIVRQVKDEIIARLRADGFIGYAQLAELGDDPEYDS